MVRARAGPPGAQLRGHRAGCAPAYVVVIGTPAPHRHQASSQPEPIPPSFAPSSMCRREHERAARHAYHRRSYSKGAKTSCPRGTIDKLSSPAPTHAGGRSRRARSPRSPSAMPTSPWRALVFLAGVMTVSCALAWLLGAWCAVPGDLSPECLASAGAGRSPPGRDPRAVPSCLASRV